MLHPCNQISNHIWPRSTTTPKPQNQVQGTFLLDLVVPERTAIFQLHPLKDKPLLVRWNPFLILNFALNFFNGVIFGNIESNCLTGEGLYKDLHVISSSISRYRYLNWLHFVFIFYKGLQLCKHSSFTMEDTKGF